IIRRKNLEEIKISTERIYVMTMIDGHYTSQVHTIRVTAYSSNNLMLDGQTTKRIQAKMLPNFTVDYVKPNGERVELSQANYELNSYYVANGVDSQFRITKINANGELTFELDIPDLSEQFSTNDFVEITLDHDDLYTLHFKNGYNSILTDKTLTIKIGATQTWPNGNFDVIERVLTLTIADFVVHDVHLTRTQNINGVDYLYGYRNNPIKSQFYFDPLDVSFYLNNGVGYNVDSSPTEQTESIINILKALNQDDSIFAVSGSQKSGLSISAKDGYIEFNYTNLDTQTTIDVEIVATLKLHYKDGSWIYGAGGEGEITCVETNTYGLMLTQQTSEEEFLAIENQTDFESMLPEQNYVLKHDITLVDYNPIDVKINQFNGNGHKITINSFATAEFKDAEAKIGLFKEVYEGTIINNLEVCYNLGKARRTITGFKAEYYDLYNSACEIKHTSVDFGGITPTNNGIITNCKISGIVAIMSSDIDVGKTDTSLDIKFNIGALVGTNGASGYITDSESKLRIIAKANISGFVYRNEGKISACRYDASTTSKAYIYAYNEQIIPKYEIKVAGFVVENSNTGDISMCYVKSGVTTYNDTNKIGNIASKNASAGFAYTNMGDIYDCYTDVENVGGNSQFDFCGMLFENSGKVERCFTYINKGVKTNIINLFAPSGTEGVVDCYEIKEKSDDTYKSGIKGLKTIDARNRNNQAEYPAFGFGTNSLDSNSATWGIRAGNLPYLVATEEIIAFGENEDLQELKEITTEIYDETGTIIISIITTYKLEEDNYGESYNPIIIYNLSTWNRYLGNSDNTAKYYRLVADIDFTKIYTVPTTSTVVFKGNLQGNNMKIIGVTLNSPNEADAVGLFKQLSGTSDPTVVNSVRNLTVTAKLVRATKTKAVGILAGIIEDFNLYNVSVSAESMNVDNIIIGGNAVGGLAGIIRGKFNIEHISTNASVHSIGEDASIKYVPYVSTNNKAQVSQYLASNHYAGSLAGILDGYIKGSTLDINSENRTMVSYVKDIKISSGLTIMADTAGYAFGFVGELTEVSGINIDVAKATISAQLYAGGFVGENRGRILNSSVTITSDDTFKGSTNVIGGFAGLNIGGTIDGCKVVLNIYKDNDCTVGGVVGHNFAGTICNCTIGGEVKVGEDGANVYFGKFTGEYVGLIIGGDYSLRNMKDYGYGHGAFDSKVKAENIIPNPSRLDAKRVKDCVVGKDTIDYSVSVLNTYYDYNDNGDYTTIQLSKYKVFGLIIGLTMDYVDDYKFNAEKTTIKDAQTNKERAIFKLNCWGESALKQNLEGVKLNNFKDSLGQDVTYDIEDTYVIEEYACETGLSILTYLVGAKASNINSWARTEYAETARLILLYGKIS
ncbi:MAG: hypothetical protein MJ152_00715, partial [Clostridia bacterium]|nr:hypothetical protein [Clostridia bacterium]